MFFAWAHLVGADFALVLFDHFQQAESVSKISNAQSVTFATCHPPREREHSSLHLLLPNQKLALHTNVKQTNLLKTHNNSLIANTTPSKLIPPNTMHCNGILPPTPPLPPTSQSLLKPHQNTDYSGLGCWRCDSGITVEFVPAGGAPVHYSGCAVNADFSWSLNVLIIFMYHW